jgi:hypothetical protein
MEALISASIGSIVMAGLMMGTVALSRAFRAVEDYSDGTIDQARTLDYIARDVRRALSLAVTASPATLTVTVADQYANAAPSRVFSEPVVSATGIVYGAGSVNVSYVLNGGQISRQEGGVSTVVANNVVDFSPVIDPADPTGKTVVTSITFAPTFRPTVTSDAIAGTKVTNCAFSRNK